jgi:transcriptional antiterminator
LANAYLFLPIFTSFYRLKDKLSTFEKTLFFKVSKTSGRIVIYPKDVQRLTGKSEKSSRELFKKIRLCKAKEKHQFVSIEDFAEFTGISVDLIKQHLTD